MGINRVIHKIRPLPVTYSVLAVDCPNNSMMVGELAITADLRQDLYLVLRRLIVPFSYEKESAAPKIYVDIAGSYERQYTKVMRSDAPPFPQYKKPGDDLHEKRQVLLEAILNRVLPDLPGRISNQESLEKCYSDGRCGTKYTNMFSPGLCDLLYQETSTGHVVLGKVKLNAEEYGKENQEVLWIATAPLIRTPFISSKR